MKTALTQKYAQLKAAAAEPDNAPMIDKLMIDILQLLHQEFQLGSGRQKEVYEHAYYQLDCTFAAHRSTKQDTSNRLYLSEVGLQVGRDIEVALLSRPN